MSRQRVAVTVLGACGLLVGLLVVPAPVSAAPATPRTIGFTDDRDELRGVLLEKPWDSASPYVIRRYALGQETTHEGEASVRAVDSWESARESAFVSTRDGQPDGEVYVTLLEEFPVQQDGESTEAVTCDNDATESHPVVSPNGQAIAFASDRAGTWDIYVATRSREVPGPDDDACEGWRITQVTDVPEETPSAPPDPEPAPEPADELWPAWTTDGSGLVFSSTRDDPLGDLYYLGGRTGTDPLRLTDDPGAETQPAVTSFDSEGSDWVAFTTTRFRPDGSLAFLELNPDPGAGPSAFVSAWADSPRQSGEASWSPRPDYSIDPQLAFTSTDADPSGDIWVGAVTFDNPEEVPRLQGEVPVVAEAGVAESHAAWREGFAVSEPVASLTVDGESPNALVFPNTDVPVDASGSTDDLGMGLTYRFDFGDGSLPVVRTDPETTHAFPESEPGSPFPAKVTVTNALGESDDATVMVTSREPVISRPPPFAGRPPRAARTTTSASSPPSRSVDRGAPGRTVPFAADPDAQQSAVLVYTARSHDADISEVVAADGSDRTTVVDRTFEDVEFSFAYDEAGPAYSRDGQWLAYSRDDLEGGRRIVVERVDGTQVAEIPAGRTPGSVDVDPAWSPDGTQIAFTRYRLDNRENYESPEIWVVRFPTGQARAVTDNDAYQDTGPTWSPDGRRIAFARADAEAEVTRARSRAEPIPPDSPQRITVVDADDGDNVRTLRYPLPPEQKVRPTVLGDSPAWSPDGAHIAFHVDGAVRVVDLKDTLDAPGADVPERVVEDRSVTGFEGFDQTGAPTESRPFISVAEDPAWAPDGAEIAFAGQPAGRPDQRGIYAIQPDGSGLRTVAQAAGPETEPAYREPQADVRVEVTVTGSPAVAGDPVVATYTVTNDGPATARKVVLTTTHTTGADASGSGPGCSVDGSGCASRDLAPGQTFDYDVTLEHEEAVEGVARGEVTTASFDPDLVNNVDEEPYEVVEDELPEAALRVDIEVDRAKGWVGGHRTVTITVANDGPDDAEEVELVAAYPTPQLVGESADTCLEELTACTLGTMASGDEQVLEVDLLLAEEGTAELLAAVTTTTDDPDEADNTDEARLKVLQPVLRILPAVGRTGQVVLAYGEKFPPRTDVMLRWDKGLIVDPGPFRVARDGTMRVPLLLVRHDRLGDRELVARSVPEEFSPVRTEVLVAARLMAAPTFLTRG